MILTVVTELEASCDDVIAASAIDYVLMPLSAIWLPLIVPRAICAFVIVASAIEAKVIPLRMI